MQWIFKILSSSPEHILTYRYIHYMRYINTYTHTSLLMFQTRTLNKQLLLSLLLLCMLANFNTFDVTFISCILIMSKDHNFFLITLYKRLNVATYPEKRTSYLLCAIRKLETVFQKENRLYL